MASPIDNEWGNIPQSRADRVEVIGAQAVLDENNTIFSMEVSSGPMTKWTIQKRLGSFNQLQRVLSAKFFHVTPLPANVDPTSGSYAEVMMRDLQSWLNILLMTPRIAASSEFQYFLHSSDIGGSRKLSIMTGLGGMLDDTGMEIDGVPQITVSAMDLEIPSNKFSALSLEDEKMGVTGSVNPARDNEQFLRVDSPVNPRRESTAGTYKAKAARLVDFALMKVIGKGSFGKVMLVRKIDDNKIYAMKVLAKESVIKRNQVEHTKTERSVLEYIRHPFIVTLRYAFQTKQKLFFVLDYCPGGELFFHLGRAGKFREQQARFYAAQIVLALEYLHSLGIVYRDLKPENVLLDAEGNIALTDFGLSKEGITDNTSAHSFCGTPEYLAPEILTRAGHGRAADWWSLGALLYEMMTGMPPFYSRSRDRLFNKILKAELRFPKYFTPEACSLMQGLLTREPDQRLGSVRDAVDLKTHAFFRDVDWEQLYHKRLATPFKPALKDLRDTTNFDAEFTSMPVDSVDTRGAHLSSGRSLSVSDGRFYGFTFVNPDNTMTGIAK